MRGAAWLSIQRVGSQIIAIATFIILGDSCRLRPLAPWRLRHYLSDFLRLFVSAGFPRMLVQRFEVDDTTADTAFWTSMAIAVVLTGGLLLVAPLIAEGLSQPELTDFLRILSVVLLMAGLEATQSALADRLMLFRVQATRPSWLPWLLG